MKIAILGTGLTALTMAAIMSRQGTEVHVYDCNSSIVKSTGFSMGPLILNANVHSYGSYKKQCDFLEMLGYNLDEVRPRYFSVGYFEVDDGGEFAEVELTQERRENYAMRTRGSKIVRDDYMSSGKEEVYGWDMNELALLDTLKNDLLSHSTNSTLRLGVLSVEFLDRLKESYDTVYNTIPLEVIMKSVGDFYSAKLAEDCKKETLFIYFKGDKSRLFRNASKSYDYMYNVSAVTSRNSDIDYKRITRLHDGMVYELIGSHEALAYQAEQFNKQKLSNMPKTKLMKNMIVKDLKQYEIYGLKNVGRFSQVKHSYKIDDTIKEFLK